MPRNHATCESCSWRPAGSPCWVSRSHVYGVPCTCPWVCVPAGVARAPQALRERAQDEGRRWEKAEHLLPSWPAVCIQMCAQVHVLTHSHTPIDLFQGTQENRDNWGACQVRAPQSRRANSQAGSPHWEEEEEEVRSARRTLVLIYSPPLLSLLFPPSASPPSTLLLLLSHLHFSFPSLPFGLFLSFLPHATHRSGVSLPRAAGLNRPQSLLGGAYLLGGTADP